MKLETKYSFAILASFLLLTSTLIGSSWQEFDAAFRIFTLNIAPRTQVAALEGAGSGLVGWWKFDEGSGTTASDSSGNGNNGTWVGPPTIASSQAPVGPSNPAALNFDGTAQYINTTLPVSPAEFPSLSMFAWVKPSAVGTGVYHAILSGDDGGWESGGAGGESCADREERFAWQETSDHRWWKVQCIECRV